MSREVWRFFLSERVKDGPIVVSTMTLGDEIVHFGRKDGDLCVWAVVDTITRGRPHTGRTFRFRGTGHPVQHHEQHVGTIVEEPFVWHLFEEVDL
jgi:hypothetical protein